MEFKNSNVRMVTDYCNCRVECDCEPSYHFTVNKCMGYGSVDLCQDTDGKESFYGNFCGIVIDCETIDGVIKQVERSIALMWECLA
jgi:hypothetical protein